MPLLYKMLPLPVLISSILFFLLQAAHVFLSISIQPNKPLFFMRVKHLLCAAAITLITVLACQKEVSIDNIPGTNQNTTVSATVVGRIVDESGAPVQGALVKAGAGTIRTNINGEFRLNSVTLSERTAFVAVEKSGYFTGSRTFVAKAGQKHYVEIQLLPKSTAGTVNATAGGTIALTNGSTLTLPASGVVTKSTGAAYTGAVQVAMTWIDPTSANLMRQMPGDLRGINEANAEVGLQSFGMLGVELTGTGGEALQIAAGKKASLKFPLPTVIAGTAPATVALWSFNDSTGLWKQEGTATKNGAFYTAEVGHFSFWNCDAPFPVVNFTAKLVNQSGQPLQHVMVKILRPSVANYWAGYGWTDSSGNVSGLVPANEPLVMEVYNTYSCSQAIYTQNIGPFSTATNLGTITISLSTTNSFTVTGSVVNCSNTAVTTGYVAVSTGLSIYYAPIINGAFSAMFTSCSGGQQAITYYAVDSTNSVQSTPATTMLTAGSTSLGTITACGLSNQRYINFTLDGTAYAITSPPDSTTGWSTQSQTLISGYKGSATTYTNLSTRFLDVSTGSFRLDYISVRTPTFTDSLLTPVGTINVNVTEYGTVGAFISGSFTGTVNGTGNTPHAIQCTFRVRRD